MRRLSLLSLALLAALALASCKKKVPDSLDEERFSEDQLWDLAEKELADEDYRKAASYLKLLLDQYPTGKRVKEAHLRYADALFSRGTDANLIEAQAKYLSYLSFYPEDAQADYAQLRVALCAYERRGKENRDQTVTRDAINELEKLLQNYPKTTHADEARARLRELKDELAAHELVVARFYRRRGFEESAVRRLKFLLDKYPDYSRRDEVYFFLAETLMKEGRPEEAIGYLERLRQDHAGSPRAEEGRAMEEDAREASESSRTSGNGGQGSTSGGSAP